MGLRDILNNTQFLHTNDDEYWLGHSVVYTVPLTCNVSVYPQMTAVQLPGNWFALNWLTSAAVMQWHADTPWQKTLCPSLSEPQIVNAFKSDYVARLAATTAAEARISFELRPTIRWLWSSLFTAENYCVFGRKRKKKRKWKIHFRPKNENVRNHQK